MSIFSDAVNFVAGIPGDIKDAVSKIKHAITAVWFFLIHIGGLITGAWDWMVNGVAWFSGQVSNWAAAVYSTAWHTLTNVIPGAAAWAVRKALGLAGVALAKVEGWLKGLIHNAIRWAKGELHKLAATAKGWVNSVIRFVTAPIRWIYHVAKGAVELVLHPEALAKWLVGHLVVPLVLWVMRSGSPVLSWFIKRFIASGGELAALLEDVITKVA